MSSYSSRAGRPEPIEQARRRHRLPDVAARTGVVVPRMSGSVSVRCPLPTHGHHDSSPSMRLHLDDDIWHCYGACARSGDVVEWVKLTETVDWRQAVTILDSGRPLTNAWPGPGGHHHRPRPTGNRGSQAQKLPDPERTPPGRLHEVLDAAWAIYTAEPQHRAGICYLARRGLAAGILEDHTGRPEIGHTPTSPTGIVAALARQGFTADELIDAAVARRHPNGTLCDTYRNRLIIPIRHTDTGQLCGFIGRITDNHPHAPKYLNPPRTALYDKSINLYQPLPPPTHPQGHVVIVEGTLDALAIATTAIRAGQEHRYCPLTQSGRELSPHQLTYTLTISPNPPVVAFDGDPPGRDSTRRLIHTAHHQHHTTLHPTHLPDGEDPATILTKHGPQALGVFAGCGPIDPEPRHCESSDIIAFQSHPERSHRIQRGPAL